MYFHFLPLVHVHELVEAIAVKTRDAEATAGDAQVPPRAVDDSARQADRELRVLDHLELARPQVELLDGDALGEDVERLRKHRLALRLVEAEHPGRRVRHRRLAERGRAVRDVDEERVAGRGGGVAPEERGVVQDAGGHPAFGRRGQRGKRVRSGEQRYAILSGLSTRRCQVIKK